ncbi:MAG TPA: hypothetical protein P5250_00145 [Bacteroidales bacterium]|nr:hypothetical protein [Bacteroidales bacterium]
MVSLKKNNIKTWIKKNIILLGTSILLLIVMHLPFLQSDPDAFVDVNTRGAWTDEGLYSSQIINYINTGEFNIEENNQMVISPLFTALLYPFYLIFGTNVLVGRLVVLFFISFSLFICFKKKELQYAGLIVIPVLMTQYQVFHFSHYNMPEMVCVGWILLAFASANNYFLQKKKYLFFIFLSSFFLFCAYSTKIQFLTSALVLPVSLFFYAFNQENKKKTKLLIRFKPFFISLIFTVLFFVIYIAFWYLSNKSFYDKVWSYETAGRFPVSFIHLWQLIKFHFNFTLWVKELKPLFIFSALGVLLSFFVFLDKDGRKYSGSLLFLFFWSIAEFTKISASYLPYRYLLGFIMSFSLFGILSLAHFFKKSIFFKYLIIVASAIVCCYNIGLIYKSYHNRTYQIKAVNSYLKQFNLENKTILGTWSHTLARNTKAKCITVKRGYLNDNNFIFKYNPVLVISENNEADSDSVFLKNGIILNNISDSSRQFTVWRYKINLYWINQTFKNDYLRKF